MCGLDEARPYERGEIGRPVDPMSQDRRVAAAGAGFGGSVSQPTADDVQLHAHRRVASYATVRPNPASPVAARPTNAARAIRAGGCWRSRAVAASFVKGPSKAPAIGRAVELIHP